MSLQEGKLKNPQSHIYTLKFSRRYIVSQISLILPQNNIPIFDHWMMPAPFDNFFHFQVCLTGNYPIEQDIAIKVDGLYVEIPNSLKYPSTWLPCEKVGFLQKENRFFFAVFFFFFSTFIFIGTPSWTNILCLFRLTFGFSIFSDMENLNVASAWIVVWSSGYMV